MDLSLSLTSRRAVIEPQCMKAKKSPSEFLTHAHTEDDFPKAGQSLTWHLQTEGKKEKITAFYLVFLVAAHPRCPSISNWNILPAYQPWPFYTLFSYVQVILQHLLGRKQGGSISVVIVYQFKRAVCIFP